MAKMAASISQELEDLLNPLPTFVDPEDDQDEETKAKVIEKFDEGHDDGDEPASGQLRKRSLAILADTDQRYRGKATSRKQLQKEFDGSADEEEEEDDEENEMLDKYMESIEDEEEDDEEENDDDEEDDYDSENNDKQQDVDSDDDEDLLADHSSQMSSLVSKMKGTDFMKLTEGMDNLGDSEDEEDSSEHDEEGESDEASEEEEEEEEEEGEEEESALRTFSKEKVDEQVEKGKAVKNQLGLWDLVLEGRIKMQKALVTANQLPQSQTFPKFKNKGGPEYAEALKNSHKALKALQRSLLELQDLLFYQNPETREISQGKTWSAKSNNKDDEEINSEDDDENADDDSDEEQKVGRNRPPKRKLEMAEYPSFMAKRFAIFQPYRDTTLQKWYDKTRLTMGKTNKGFGSFDRNILTQVEQVLMDKERIVRRTQTRRSQYRVLGKPEPDNTISEGEAAELALKANVHLKDLDEEIFDDDDFYHQLLRELIERKTSAVDPNDQVAMGRQWLAIQKLRSKIKKKVDTKASKGRKIRFHVHSKLMNFMAPIDNSSMSDDARSELYRSLFANGPVNGPVMAQ